MDRETIIKAISDPTLVRRAFAAIREDPGPLKLMLSEGESLLGYDVSYRYYTSGNRDIIVASDFGPLEPRMGVMYSIGRAAKYINRVGAWIQNSRYPALPSPAIRRFTAIV